MLEQLTYAQIGERLNIVKRNRLPPTSEKIYVQNTWRRIGPFRENLGECLKLQYPCFYHDWLLVARKTHAGRVSVRAGPMQPRKKSEKNLRGAELMERCVLSRRPTKPAASFQRKTPPRMRNTRRGSRPDTKESSYVGATGQHFRAVPCSRVTPPSCCPHEESGSTEDRTASEAAHC